jgi:hypothetical protein
MRMVAEIVSAGGYGAEIAGAQAECIIVAPLAQSLVAPYRSI